MRPGTSAILTAVPGPDWGTVLGTWHTTWAAEVAATALAALYLRTAVHVGAWPVPRTVSAMAALAVAVATIDSGLGGSGSFATGVVMRLLLLTVVPALWVAGRPLELLRRGSSGRVADALDGFRAAAVVRAVTSGPGVLVVYALVVVLTGLTAFPAAVATSPALLVAEQLLCLAAGLPFFATALGPDRPVGPRLLLLIAAAAVEVVVGCVLATSVVTLGPVFSSDDVRLGGSVTAVAGGGLLLVITAASAGHRAAFTSMRSGPGPDHDGSRA